ncbi:MAG: tRNA threonylcarbamoyladenosine dehydratase [Verrucomicrobiota bacterium]
MDTPSSAQFDARFGGVMRLFGTAGAARLRRAHVCVIGVGGVGSWAVEALARSGIGTLTLVDLDDVCISNVNRQSHALTGTFGKPKVEVMTERVRAINPDCQVRARQEFFLKSNAEDVLGGGYDCVLDAIDQTALKCLLLAMCREKKIPIVTTGGAAGRRDPTAIEIADLAQTGGDPLLAEVRKRLRAEYGFPRDKELFGIECAFSKEPMVYSQTDGTVSCERGTATDLRIDCNTGLGTAAFVTSVFGMAAASCVVRKIVG